MLSTYRIFIIIILLFYSFLYSCGNEGVEVKKEVNFLSDSLSCSAFLKTIKIKEIDSTKYSFIYAKFKVNNISDKGLLIFLKDFKLILKENKVGTLYIDSIASVLIEAELIKPHTIIAKSVYWSFTGVIEEKDIIDAMILYEDTVD